MLPTEDLFVYVYVGSMPGNLPYCTESHQADTNRRRHGSGHNRARLRTRMPEANVKMIPTET